MSDDEFHSSASASESGGNETDGDSRNRISVYLTHEMEYVINRISWVLNISSNTETAAKLLEDNAAEIETMTRGIYHQSMLVRQYRRIDDEVETVSYDDGMAMIGDTTTKELRPEVHHQISGIISKITSSLDCSRSTACRIIILKGIYEVISDYDVSENVSDTDIIDCIEKWQAISRKVENFFLDFEIFLRSNFNINRGKTVDRMVSRPGLAKRFASRYYFDFIDSVGHNEAKDRLGEEYINYIDGTLQEVDEELPDSVFNLEEIKGVDKNE